MRVLAQNGAPREDPDGILFARPEQRAAHFQAAVRQLLETIAHSRPDLVHHLERVLDSERDLGNLP